MDERDLKALLTLQAVARSGGFAGAARELGSTRAAVSRLIAEAEARLGVRLCHRTTRRVALTEAAATLMRQAGPHLEALQSAWAALPDTQGAFQGLIRLSSSHAFGRLFVLPVVAQYRQQHPAVRFEIRLADVIDDLVARSLDVAVRIGPLPDSTLVARNVGRIEVQLVAAPALLRGRPAPRRLSELQGWPLVAFQPPGTGQRRAWVLRGPQGELQHQVQAPVAEVDSVEGLADLLRAGVGLGLAPRYLVQDDLVAGRLVPVLKTLRFLGPEVHVCYTDRKLMPQRVRAFIDLLVPELQRSLASVQTLA